MKKILIKNGFALMFFPAGMMILLTNDLVWRVIGLILMFLSGVAYLGAIIWEIAQENKK